MAEHYARCNNFMSGAVSSPGVNCNYMARGATQEEVLEQVMTHLSGVHSVDGNDLVETIKRCIFERGTKAILNRGPS